MLLEIFGALRFTRFRRYAQAPTEWLPNALRESLNFELYGASVGVIY
jgi:hypothetical protein